MHLIRQRTGLRDLDEIARLAAPLVQQYRPCCPPTAAAERRSTGPVSSPPSARWRWHGCVLKASVAPRSPSDWATLDPSTVRRHLCSLRRRLEVQTTDEALAKLAAHGLLSHAEE